MVTAANKRQPLVLRLSGAVGDQQLQKHVLPALKQNLFVFELDLSHCPLSNSAVGKLCSLLKKDATLRSLRLSYNHCLGK